MYSPLGNISFFGSRISTGRLKWTHGAMGSEASLGFVMSDVPGWQAPEVVRFDEALRSWATGATSNQPEEQAVPEEHL